MSGNITIRHVGLNIEYDDPDSAAIKLTPDVEDCYGIEKEHALIFIETSAGDAFSAEELLQGYFRRSGKPLGEHLPDMTGRDRIAVSFPVRFPENTFHMMTDRGAVPIKTLMIAVEVTVK
jgi:hypothetical protein